MSTYTAGDFAKAHFATHPDGRIAARLESEDVGSGLYPWQCSDMPGRSDRAMSEDGFAPFPESRPLPVEVTEEMVEAFIRAYMNTLGSADGAVRAGFAAALAAAPTTDEDVRVAGSRASLGSLVEKVRDGGSRCQVDRVVIAPCDEYGSTDTERRLYAERDRLLARCEEIVAEHERADACAERAERLWDAIFQSRDIEDKRGEAPTESIVTAVLPIVEAEVRKAKAEALREAAGDIVWSAETLPHMTPHDAARGLMRRAAKYETGDQS